MRIQRIHLLISAVLLAVSWLTSGTVSAAEPAATVILAVGAVNDRATDGSQRALRDGDRVYSGDSLSTGESAYLDMDFNDGGRMLLRPGTEFEIESFHYQSAAQPENAPPVPAAEHESAFFRLFKGGLRAISGLIGHVYRDNYRLDTPVATIGIRGTEYETRYCADNCGDEEDKSGVPQNGLYTAVNRGAIALNNQTSETITTAGQYLYVHDARSAIRTLASRSAALRHMNLPQKYQARDDANRRRHENKHLMEKRLRERRRLRIQLRHHMQRAHGGG